MQSTKVHVMKHEAKSNIDNLTYITKQHKVTWLATSIKINNSN